MTIFLPGNGKQLATGSASRVGGRDLRRPVVHLREHRVLELSSEQTHPQAAERHSASVQGTDGDNGCPETGPGRPAGGQGERHAAEGWLLDEAPKSSLASWLD